MKQPVFSLIIACNNEEELLWESAVSLDKLFVKW